MLTRERPRATSCALIPPQPDRADRALSALAGALFLVSWVVAYVGLVPADDPQQHVRVAAVEVRR